MAKRISLFGRKRMSDLAQGTDAATALKKDELMALKLQELNQNAKASGTLQALPLTKIQADPNQPRKVFRHIDSLAASIKEQGVIQPIIVTTANEFGRYTIIAGERRFLAAKRAGLNSIPCIIRQESDANIVILQLLENDQREAVSPVEESDALAKLINQMKMSKSEVARELGHDPAWVSIRLGLQQASDQIKQLVKDQVIEDVRTLHELRMLEEEQPKVAAQLIERVRHNQVSGSYRQVFAKARKASPKAKQRQPAQKTIQKMEKVGDKLLLHVGGKRPIQYTLTKEAMVRFLASVTYD